jgi:hypothetical protein
MISRLFNGMFHIVVNALSRSPNYIELVGILYQTCDAHMFTLQP